MSELSATDISVVIPAYNAEKYLLQAVDSVRSQTVSGAKIIVVDDGSTDGSAEIARGLAEVVYVRKDNGGVASALNVGVRTAETKLIAFLSADDIWDREKLARQLAALNSASNRLVFGHMQHFISPELTPEVAATLVCPPEPMPAFSAGTLLTARENLLSVGPFNETFAVGEFIDWYGRAKDTGLETMMLNDVVSMRRVHSANHSAKTLKTKSYAPVLKALIDRRRAEQQAKKS